MGDPNSDNCQFEITALIDSGCTGSFIDTCFIKAKGLNTISLPCPIPVYNANARITNYVVLCIMIRDHSKKILFGVTDLGKLDMFIGHKWLKRYNSQMNWQEGTLEFDCSMECLPYATVNSNERK